MELKVWMRSKSKQVSSPSKQNPPDQKPNLTAPSLETPRKVFKKYSGESSSSPAFPQELPHTKNGQPTQPRREQAKKFPTPGSTAKQQ
jgi:hypothetical protein